MKLTTFLLLVACLQISAKGLSQQISLSETKAPLKKVLKSVARQAGISIVYDEDLLATAHPVTIDVKNVPVRQVLEMALENQPFSYVVDGSRIIVKSLPETKAAADTTITVTGRITDEKGEPVPGTSIRIKDSKSGTVTDVTGFYSIKVPHGATLLVNALGFEPLSWAVTKSSMSFTLKIAQTALTETVVVGYGVQKKSVVTGAISSVRASELESQPVTRLEGALQGRTSGVTIASGSGQPGSGATVRVRGITTFNNNDPLWVVDGVVVDNGGIGYLNQYDIESIEVLKDAASQAIYGARAAAGVILVTTKKGKAGTLQVNYNGYYGTSAPARKLKLLDATQYATLRNEAAFAANPDPNKALPFADPASLGKGTDWQSLIFNNSAKRQNHEVSISGGNDKSTFYSSFGYLKQDGIVATDISKYERVNLRLNSIHKLSKYVTFGENVGYAYDKALGIGNTNSEFGGPLNSAINLDPTTPAVITDPAVAAGSPYTNVGIRRDANGNPYGISKEVGQEIINPLAYISTRLGNYNWSHNIVGNTYLEVVPIKGLKIRSTLGSKIAFWGSENFTPLSYLNSSTINTRTSFSRNQNTGYGWNLENTASYTRDIRKNSFTILLGQGAYMDNRSKATTVTYYDLPASTFGEASMNFNVASTNRVSSGSEGADHKLSSLFARVNYAYDEKYLVEAIVRRDGSSRFGANHKYGTFPSFSLGWNISKEGFWPQQNIVNFLKLRGGYGVVGNDNIGDFAYLSTIGSGRNYSFGTDGVYLIGYSPNAPSNPDLKWESTSQTNIGFEATVYNDFRVGFDWYKKVTKDILQNPRIPSYVGAISNPAANIADMQNTGVELELGYHKKLGEVELNVNGNVSYTTNKVTNLGRGISYQSGGQSFQSSSYPITRTALGQPLNSFYGFKTNGIFQTQAEVNNYVSKAGGKIQPDAKPGDFRWVDTNGDGAITELDRQFLGNPTPTWTYGGTINAAYKGVDIVVFIQGSAGNKIFQGLRRLDILNANWQTKALGRWTGPGTSNDYPRLINSDPNRNFTNPSDFYLENGSYCRIKSLQLGYSIPTSITKRAGIQKFRVYVMSENLLTFTKYTGYDPEIGGGVFSIDRGIYPQARSFMLGVNATF
ncbi:TonB-dependent receptor [Chitinophaga sancti]|uniref:TonB-dependent receptor n=1 Tax=Chitinophaga sancti TaxID=1004 RepID=A0A1K1SRA1_9BACT|nr:TonB-dependent receptor [Chitinophaga sancti]WQD65336.1 TonB-dependent receptor [Chitinophaga sancti]WQG89040.1 TonB-dependent receptor [Chitinophaga sancti]SFW86826.1 TonB-linked outer membrane protein, SusC/RagA family [Chitinophaga sancti]